MTSPTDDGSGDGPGTGPRPVDIPGYFTGYEVTYFSSLGRAQLAGATDDELRNMRDAMYDGWMRPNRYDDQGNQIFGYEERRAARQDYQRMEDLLSERNPSVNPAFDWEAWREDYDDMMSGNGGASGRINGAVT